MPKHKKREAPKVGATFHKTYKGKAYTLRVIRAASDIAYSLGGVAYETPTAAAISITGNSVNGWRFWGIDVS